MKIELNITIYLTTSYITNSDSASPLLIGLQPDSGNKNSHLRTLTRQQADREKTKICT